MKRMTVDEVKEMVRQQLQAILGPMIKRIENLETTVNGDGTHWPGDGGLIRRIRRLEPLIGDNSKTLQLIWEYLGVERKCDPPVAGREYLVKKGGKR